MRKVRVLLTNEPRSYREAIALALEAVRPNAEVVTADPEDLDGKVRGFGPRLVICSRVSPLVEAEVPVWVELYTEHGPDSVVSVGGRRSTVAGMDLKDLIGVFDRTLSLSLGAV